MMEFPNGSMLTVLRDGEADVFGDAPPDNEHQIGPCSVPKSGAGHTETRGDRDTSSLNVSAPPDSDILKSDRVRLPDGKIATVTSEVYAPVNPFTGWAPFKKFALTEVT